MQTRCRVGGLVKLEVIYAPAAATVYIYKLLVEYPIDEIHVLHCHQEAPPSVMNMSGIAASDTQRMITK